MKRSMFGWFESIMILRLFWTVACSCFKMPKIVSLSSWRAVPIPRADFISSRSVTSKIKMCMLLVRCGLKICDYCDTNTSLWLFTFLLYLVVLTWL